MPNHKNIPKPTGNFEATSNASNKNGDTIAESSRFVMRLILVASLAIPSACGPKEVNTPLKTPTKSVQPEETDIEEKGGNEIEERTAQKGFHVPSLPHVDREPPKLIKDPDEALRLITESPDDFNFNLLDDSLSRNHDFILKITRINAELFRFADASLRSNASFMLRIIKIESYLFIYANASLQKSRKFIRRAIRANPYVIGCAGMNDDPEMRKLAGMPKGYVGTCYVPLP